MPTSRVWREGFRQLVRVFGLGSAKKWIDGLNFLDIKEIEFHNIMSHTLGHRSFESILPPTCDTFHFADSHCKLLWLSRKVIVLVL